MKGTLDTRLSELSNRFPIWTPTTIYHHFEATAQDFPQETFIAQDEIDYTYENALSQVQIVAKALILAGIRTGDHVAVQMPNSALQIFTCLALALLGAVKIPINLSLGAYELNYILTQSDSKFFFTSLPYNIEPAARPLLLTSVILVENLSLPPLQSGTLDFSTLKSKAQYLSDPDLDKYTVGPDYANQFSDIIYTSGSTGAPKGVMLTHDMLMRSAFANCLNRGFELGRRVYVPLPLFHCYGYIEGLLAVILVGGAILIQSHKFVAEESIPFMIEQRANDILSVPIMMIHLIRHLQEHPTSFPDLHAVYCSAALCPPWVWPGIRQYLQVEDVITGYGMTEVSGASMQTCPDDSDQILNSRVGKILMGGVSGIPSYGGQQLQYRVISQETQEDCPPGVPGELLCRGSTVTRGYYNQPEANTLLFEPGGWLHTGDMGVFDEQGYLLLHGRANDMYKINGENVSPKFLEHIISQCEVVSSVEIVGIPNHTYGALGIAFIQLKQDTPNHRLQLEAYCSDHLASFQVPSHYVYLSSGDWPLTSTGKVQKFSLRQRALSLFGTQSS